ncbi:uncharacterized protein LOC133197826 [Saccostrea echinata]|uniref:uncharacterized protein LOC133197826 n=1 Tax=Saccostrea echinata TaxID=191078 RepID=UPI002A7F2F65|nr:uncharacterized protein LOC133197826 [Saccostrea echinata]
MAYLHVTYKNSFTKCEKLRCQVTAAVTEEDKLMASDAFKYQIEVSQVKFFKCHEDSPIIKCNVCSTLRAGEHMIYRESVQAVRSELEEYGHRPVGRQSSSTSLYNVHYTFDFAQQLTIPHHARQEGQLYFTSPRKVQLFGVCMEGGKKQYNYLFDEDQMIGVDGTKAHGLNTVITLLHHTLQNYGCG